MIKNLRQLKGYTATRFLTEFKTKTGHDEIWITCWRKLAALDPLIVWLAVVIPALPVLLATSKKWRRRLSACVRVHGAHFEHKF